ncbi:unnamed protein product [Prunus armeniaca]
MAMAILASLADRILIIKNHLAKRVFVCANNLTGKYSLLDPSTFDLPSLSSSIPVKQIGVNRPHPGGVGQRPSDA